MEVVSGAGDWKDWKPEADLRLIQRAYPWNDASQWWQRSGKLASRLLIILVRGYRSWRSIQTVLRFILPSLLEGWAEFHQLEPKSLVEPSKSTQYLEKVWFVLPPPPFLRQILNDCLHLISWFLLILQFQPWRKIFYQDWWIFFTSWELFLFHRLQNQEDLLFCMSQKFYLLNCIGG